MACCVYKPLNAEIGVYSHFYRNIHREHYEIGTSYIVSYECITVLGIGMVDFYPISTQWGAATRLVRNIACELQIDRERTTKCGMVNRDFVLY